MVCGLEIKKKGTMMISDKIRDVLNEQINKEFYSAYLYLAMSAYFSEIGLKNKAFLTGLKYNLEKKLTME